MILHDTSEVFEVLRGRDASTDSVGISMVTLFETLRGVPPEKRSQVKQLLEETYTVLQLDNSTVLAYCRLYDRLREAKTPIPDSDLLIAATAVSNAIPLRSRDDHFERLRDHGLKLEKPRES